MILLVDEENKADFLSLCSDISIMACRISYIYESYGAYDSLARFHIHYGEKGQPAAIISQYGGIVSIYCREQWCSDEIEGFLRMTGCSFAECNSPVLCSSASGVIMRLRKKPEITDERFIYNMTQPDYRSIYKLLSSCSGEGFEVPSFEDYLVEFSHRFRHGTARFCCVEKDGKILSFAMTGAMSKNCTLIGSVCTEENSRRSHIGSACLSKLISSLDSREIFIIRAKKETEAFYKSLGFENDGNYYSFNMD